MTGDLKVQIIEEARGYRVRIIGDSGVCFQGLRTTYREAAATRDRFLELAKKLRFDECHSTYTSATVGPH